MTVNVFLSATFTDLVNERLAIITEFRRLRVVHGLDVDLVTMEDFGPSLEPPLRFIFEKLQTCQLYLGLIGQTYGSLVTEKQRSFTHLEYDRAVADNIPVIMLERRGQISTDQVESDPQKLELLNNWRDQIKKDHLIKGFNSIDDLSAILANFMPNLLRRRFPELDVVNDRTEHTYVKLFQKNAMRETFFRARRTAYSLDLLTIAPMGLFEYADEQLNELLKDGCIIRIIVIKENGWALEKIVECAQKPELVDELRATKKVAARVAKRCEDNNWPGKLTLKEHDWIPSASIFLFNSNLDLNIEKRNAVGWVGTITPDFSCGGNMRWFVELTEPAEINALKSYAQQFNDIWHKI